MGLYEAKGQLDRAMNDLTFRWSQVRSAWHDQVAVDFEEKHLVPLQAQLRNATAAMAIAASLVSRVRQECS